MIIHVHQNRAIVYNVYQHENVCINSKSQYTVPKTKWEGAEDLTNRLIISLKLITNNELFINPSVKGKINPYANLENQKIAKSHNIYYM